MASQNAVPVGSPRVSQNAQVPDPAKKERYMEWCYYFASVIATAAVFSIVFSFQYKQWPTNVNSYHTNDPSDNRDNTYYCGCGLPPAMQDKENPAHGQDVGLNVCYDSSRLEDVVVVMYSNSSAAVVEPLIKGAVSKVHPTSTDGYRIAQQAHELSGVDTQHGYQDSHDLDVKQLYPYKYKQPDDNATLKDLQQGRLLDFPSSYLRLAFTYVCSDCSRCNVPTLNHKIKDVADESWGDCFYNDRSYPCAADQSKEFMTGKCVLYPTTTIRFNFAIERLMNMFSSSDVMISHIQSVNTPNPSPSSQYLSNETSLQQNSLYMNFSQAVRSKVSLSFFEVEKGSAIWLKLLDRFPDLERGCSSLAHLEVCNGTSVCFVSTTATSYSTKCMDMNPPQDCQNLLQGCTVQNADNLWKIYGVTEGDDVSLACPHFKCEEEKIAPYLLYWSNDSHSLPMKKDSFNQFLYSQILEEEWAQRSGVCTKTYAGVLRANVNWNVTPTDIFLQTECKSNLTDQGFFNRGSGATGYCWLTGYYHNLTDLPTQDWVKVPEQYFPPPKDRFVCYRVTKMSFGHWILITFGVAAGWMSVVSIALQMLKKCRTSQLPTKALDRRTSKLRTKALDP